MPDRVNGSVRAFQSFLRKNELIFSCAESCTGGLLAREMTALAGSSEVFWGGVVAYSNQAKQHLLGVGPELILQHGAVSGPVAQAMAFGMATRSGAPVVVSVTGVAGPDGGTEEKPVGTVWFGLVAQRDGNALVTAVRHQFGGSRASIQTQTARWARILSRVWWDSMLDLDSIRSLIDNDGRPFVEASQPPFSFPITPFEPNPQEHYF